LHELQRAHLSTICRVPQGVCPVRRLRHFEGGDLLHHRTLT
jgi:hypothetical protein